MTEGVPLHTEETRSQRKQGDLSIKTETGRKRSSRTRNGQAKAVRTDGTDMHAGCSLSASVGEPSAGKERDVCTVGYVMEEHNGKMGRTSTWFGFDVTIEVGPGFLHKAGVGRWRIPHPPLMNGLIRWGVSKNASQTLSLVHEYGHIQTAPFALLYALGMLTVVGFLVSGRIWLQSAGVVLSTHAVWEIMAEMVTMARTGTFYTQCYQGVSVVPRLVFWVLTSVLTCLGWIVA